MSNVISLRKKDTPKPSVLFSKFLSPIFNNVRKESSVDQVEEFIKMENIIMDLESDWG